MRKTVDLLTCFGRDEKGAVGTEYAVLLLILAVGMGFAAGQLGDAISGAMNAGATCLNTGSIC